MASGGNGAGGGGVRSTVGRMLGRAPLPPSGPERRPRDPGRLPLVAAITMANNEGPMIRRWVEHYAQQLGAEHVFVIDDHSTDGSTDDLGCTVLRYPYLDKYDFEVARLGIVNGLAASMLWAYDAVLFADADEFIVADPKRHAGLREYVATTEGRDVIGVLGYNVVHDLAHEKPLDFNRPFLQQRALAKFIPLMCKPSLKWAPIDWGRASHGVRCPYAIDTDLIMFHLKFADLELLREKAGHRFEINKAEERAAATSWANTGDEMATLLEEIATEVPEDQIVRRFRPREKTIEAVVGQRGEIWKAVGDGQVVAMRKRPFVRIPNRFADLV